MFEENPLSLTPVNFFALECDCHSLPKKGTYPSFATHTIPSTSRLCHEHSFAKVAMGWNEAGLFFQIYVGQPPVRSSSSDIHKGDSIELMIDTRDVKTAGFNTRFCHHFFFLPKAVEGQQAGEMTHFRTEDRHPLCDSNLLVCQTQAHAKDYTMKIFIPSQCLYGYDPKQFDRLGFTYRINRANGKPQHFSVVSQDYQIEQQPSLWASIRLVT